MDRYEIHCPAAYLDRQLPKGDTLAADALKQQCRKELELAHGQQDIVSQIKWLLRSRQGRPLGLNEASAQLQISRSTLNRKLKDVGSSVQELRDDVLAQGAKQLLIDPWVSLEKIATRLGYANPANFTRSFRR